MQRQSLFHRYPVGVLLGGLAAACPDRVFRRPSETCVLLYATGRSLALHDAADRTYTVDAPRRIAD